MKTIIHIARNLTLSLVMMITFSAHAMLDTSIDTSIDPTDTKPNATANAKETDKMKNALQKAVDVCQKVHQKAEFLNHASSYVRPLLTQCENLKKVWNESRTSLNQKNTQEKLRHEALITQAYRTLIKADLGMFHALHEQSTENLYNPIVIRSALEDMLKQDNRPVNTESRILSGYHETQDVCQIVSKKRDTYKRLPYASDFINTCQPFFSAMKETLKAKKCNIENNNYLLLPSFFDAISTRHQDFMLVSGLGKMTIAQVALANAHRSNNFSEIQKQKELIITLEQQLSKMGYRPQSTGIFSGLFDRLRR